MHNEQKHDEVMAEDRSYVQVRKTGTQAFFQLQVGQQGLKNDQPGEGGQGLVYEPEDGHFVDPALDFSFAGLHYWLSPG